VGLTATASPSAPDGGRNVDVRDKGAGKPGGDVMAALADEDEGEEDAMLEGKTLSNGLPQMFFALQKGCAARRDAFDVLALSHSVWLF